MTEYELWGPWYGNAPITPTHGSLSVRMFGRMCVLAVFVGVLIWAL